MICPKLAAKNLAVPIETLYIELYIYIYSCSTVYVYLYINRDLDYFSRSINTI
jgi:hypothetical protein